MSRYKDVDELKRLLLDLLPQERVNWSYWTEKTVNDTRFKDCKVCKSHLPNHQLLKLFESSTHCVGLPLGKRTRYFIIDIDEGTQFYSHESVSRIAQLFKTRKIPVHVCQSSLSGGYHIIGIFTRRVSCRRLDKFLSTLLYRHGFHDSPGGLEVWPSKTTINRPIRLPFQQQSGFYLLKVDNDLIGYWGSAGKSFAERVTTFLSLAQANPKTANLKAPIQKSLSRPQDFDQQKYSDGKQFYEFGLTARRQRHHALFCVNYYLYKIGYGRDKADERERLLIRWISEKHNGYSKDWVTNRRTVLMDIRNMAYWESKQNIFLNRKTNSCFYEHNKSKTEEVLRRFDWAVETLRSHGGLYKKNGTLNLRAVASKGQINYRTAMKYQKRVHAQTSFLFLIGPIPLKSTVFLEDLADSSSTLSNFIYIVLPKLIGSNRLLT